MPDVSTSLLAFTAAAVLVTVTPGLDTAIVLRATVGGVRRGVGAAFGVLVGCSVWGAAATAGAAATIAASASIYGVLKAVGAAYLTYVGLKLLLRPANTAPADQQVETETTVARWFRRGLLTNILNPKVGLFYAAFLPQFVPEGAPVGAMMAAMTAIHIAAGALWFLGLIITANRAAALFRRRAVLLWLDRTLGAIFVALAARLALSTRA